MTFGTVSYAPPEWIKPDQLDPKAWDLYALGVVVYEMLTGKVAFPVSGQGSARQQAMQVIVAKQNHPPLDPGDAFHEPLRQLVRELTHPDPKKRLREAHAVRERLLNLDRSLARPTGATLMPSPDDMPLVAREDSGQTWSPEPTLDDVSGAPADRARRSRGLGPRLATVAVMGLGALVACAGVLAFGTQMFRPAPVAPTVRDVDVVVTGLPADVPVDVQVGTLSAYTTDGHSFSFDGVPLGDIEIAWSMGEGCSSSICPGDACPDWCGAGTLRRTVEEGTGVQTEPLTLEPPPPRELVLVAPDIGSKRTPVIFHVANREAERIDVHSQRFTELAPGRYEVVAEVGDCPKEIWGCQTDASCPQACSSWRGDVTLPWGTGEFRTDVPLKALVTPVASGTSKARGKTKAKATASDTPSTSGGSGAAKRAVTAGSFSAWLSKHTDEWGADAAIGAKRADANYLAGWNGATPPAGTSKNAMVNVSWYAAAAYCSGRGGLAPVDAAPTSWSMSASQPDLEWRVDGGRAAWRSGDGTASTAVQKTQSNAFTGFRCAR